MTDEPKKLTVIRGLHRHLLPYVSGSSMPMADKCPAALTLPGVGRILETGADTLGNALHDHMRDRARLGVDEAMLRLEELIRVHDLDEELAGIFIARARAFAWSPPRGSVPEQAMCLFEDGHVELVSGGKGTYATLEERPDALLPLQIDLFWAEPEPLYRDKAGNVVCPPNSMLWVIDFKSGLEDNVEPAHQNLQVLAGAVLAAKLTGARKVMPGIVFIRGGQGLWDTPEHWLELPQLREAEKRLRHVVHRVRESRTAYREGGTIPYRVGVHCRRCSARPYCEAHLNEVKMFLQDPTPLRERPLTIDQLTKLAELQQSFNRFSETVRDLLIAHTRENGPIVLPNGEHWGPTTVQKDQLNPDLTLEVLAEEIGEEDALQALEITREVTKASVERAISASHERSGIKRRKAHSMRMVMGKLIGRGGITKKKSVEFRLHRPKPAAPALPPPKSLDGLVIDEGNEQ